MQSLPMMLTMFPNYPVAALMLLIVGTLCIRYRDKRCDSLLLMALAILPVTLGFLFVERSLTFLAPVKYDEYLYLFDAKLGLPEYRIGLFLRHHPVWLVITATIYNLLPYEIVVIYGMYLWKYSEAEARQTVYTQFLMYTLIPTLYVVCPAVGPAFAFHGFPFVTPEIASPHGLSIVLGWLNCLPSGHFGMSLSDRVLCKRKWKP